MSENSPFEGGDRVFQIGYRPIVERGKRQPPAIAIARTISPIGTLPSSATMLLSLSAMSGS